MAAPLIAAAATRLAAGAAVSSATGGAAGSAAAGSGAGSLSGSAAAAQGGGGAAKLLQSILGSGGGGGPAAGNAAGGQAAGGGMGNSASGAKDGIGNMLKQLLSGGGQKQAGGQGGGSSMSDRIDSAKQSLPNFLRSGGGWGGGPTSNIATHGRSAGIAAGGLMDAASGAAKIGAKAASGDYVGATVDTVKALVEMPGKLRDMGDAALAAQRGLTQFNGGIAAAFAKLDAQRIGRNIRLGAATSSSTKGLAEAQSKLEDKMLPYQSKLANVGNQILSLMMQLLTKTIEIAEATPFVGGAIKALVDAEKLKQREAAGTIAALARDIARGGLTGRKFKPLPPDIAGLRGGAGARFDREE